MITSKYFQKIFETIQKHSYEELIESEAILKLDKTNNI